MSSVPALNDDGAAPAYRRIEERSRLVFLLHWTSSIDSKGVVSNIAVPGGRSTLVVEACFLRPTTFFIRLISSVFGRSK